MKEFIIDQNNSDAFLTIEEALSFANKGDYTDDVVFKIHGNVLVKSPIKITPNNLFNGKRKVLFAGVDNGCISGGITITDFKKYKNNIWYSDVPNIDYTRNLYIDGISAKRPATKKITASAWDHAQGNCDFYDIDDNHEEGFHTGLVTTQKEILNWKNIRDVEMVFDVGWTHQVIPIVSTQKLEDGRVYIQPLPTPFYAAQVTHGVKIGGCPSFFENVFELLYEPGQWYFDSVEKKLYVSFEEGDTPCNHEIIIPMTEQLFVIQGELDNKISNIYFKNIRFENTTWNNPHRYGHPEKQANLLREYKKFPEQELPIPFELDYVKVTGAIRVIAANNIIFDNCVFSKIDATAVYFEYGAEYCEIKNCKFNELGSGAITLGDLEAERAHHPKDDREIVRNITIKDNLIYDTGKDFRGSVAITAGYVSDCVFSHNEIHDVSYSAISIGWGWGTTDISVGPMVKTKWTTPTCCKRNIIEYNYIYNCMMELYDGGAIYTLGEMEGTKIRGNYIRNSKGYDGIGYDNLCIEGEGIEELNCPNIDDIKKLSVFPGGIYLDEASRGIEVYDNILYGVTVPLFYHNTIDRGWTYVDWHDNYLQIRPGEKGFPTDIADNAGKIKR